MTDTIIPKSDQLNADDLMTGPRTFTISEARRTGNDDQPMAFFLAEFDSKRPFKPSKSMRRIMVLGWGADAATYVGKRFTLYRDPKVKWAGQEIGGIRISHMSDLKSQLTVALTETKGKRLPYVVKPLPAESKPAAVARPVDPNAISPEKVTELGVAMTNGLELIDRADKLTWLTAQLERPIKSPTELTAEEGDRLLELIRAWTEPPADEPGGTLVISPDVMVTDEQGNEL